VKTDYRPDRRRFIAQGAALSTVAWLPGAARAGTDLTTLSAIEAVARMRSGDLRAEDYASALLARCDQGRTLNAFISLDAAQVMEAARACDRARARGERLGALHGLPIPVKDSIHVAGLPTTGGSGALREFRPKEDAPVVAALRRAGSIVLGKTNLHELSYGYTSNNPVFGAVRNPYAPDRIPGGSSGGTGACVAARMAPAGLAEDTCGSVRVPAALCGVAGLRPTVARYPQAGVIPITARMDQVGPHARTVADLALFDSVITRDGEPVRPRSLKGTRLGVPRAYFWEDLEPGVERVAREGLARLADAGAELVYADIPDLAALNGATVFPILLYETEPTLAAYLAGSGIGLSVRELIGRSSPGLKWVFETFVYPGGANSIPQDVYRAALDKHQPALKAAYRDYFERNGVAAVVFPTVPMTAPRIGDDVEVELNGKKVPTFIAMSRNIQPASAAALPGLTVPVGLSDGLPVGLEFDGPAGSDRALLGLGLAAEAVLGTLAPPML
jgi:Asp-tRNA(Asn)/Glu-tRNA(Gln) amidotransferase A subunit family amidase